MSVSLSWAASPGVASYLVAWDGGSAVTTAPQYTDMTVPCATTRTYTVTPQDANAGAIGDPATAEQPPPPARRR